LHTTEIFIGRLSVGFGIGRDDWCCLAGLETLWLDFLSDKYLLDVWMEGYIYDEPFVCKGKNRNYKRKENNFYLTMVL
jgi:hypothetical protein